MIGLVGAGAGGCRKKAPAPAASASAPAASSAPVVVAVPISSDVVRQAMNPANEPAYSGPVGSVHGTVTVKGDVPPVLPEVTEKIPEKCKNARLVYGRLFREGMVRSLADALVTVTEYKGYLPARGDVIAVPVEDCAFKARTIAMTFGQRLEVTTKEKESYLPTLIGGRMKAAIYVVPGGDPVKLYPHQPGRFTLADQIHSWMTAEVFVFKYPTHTVTGLDGKYEITGIPVGEVMVSTLLPVTNHSTQKKVKIEEGKSIEVNLEIPFDATKEMPEKPKKPEVVIH